MLTFVYSLRSLYDSFLLFKLNAQSTLLNLLLISSSSLDKTIQKLRIVQSFNFFNNCNVILYENGTRKQVSLSTLVN